MLLSSTSVKIHLALSYENLSPPTDDSTESLRVGSQSSHLSSLFHDHNFTHNQIQSANHLLPTKNRLPNSIIVVVSCSGDHCHNKASTFLFKQPECIGQGTVDSCNLFLVSSAPPTHKHSLQVANLTLHTQGEWIPNM